MSLRGMFRTAGWLLTLGGVGLSGVAGVNGLTMGDTAPEAVRTNINMQNISETTRFVKGEEQQKTLQDAFAAVNTSETVTADQARAIATHSFNVGSAVVSASSLTALAGIGLLAVTRERKKKPSYSN